MENDLDILFARLKANTPSAPAGLTDRIMQQLPPRQHVRRWVLPLRIAAVAASLLLLVSMALSFNDKQSTQQNAALTAYQQGVLSRQHDPFSKTLYDQLKANHYEDVQ